MVGVSHHILHIVSRGMMYQSMLSIWSVCSAHVVRAYHHVSPIWSECITIRRINLCCPHGQHGLPYIVHVVRVYHDTMYQSMLSTVSPYIAHVVHMVSMCYHILPMWSECLTIYCINSYCSHSQHVSPYDAHVVRVFHHILYQFILFT